MSNPFFDHPILNSPYDYPRRHWELDSTGQPTQRTIDARRKAEFITPIPKPRKQKGKAQQQSLVLDEGTGLSTAQQQYEKTATVINELRVHVDRWRAWPDAKDWLVTPETERLLQHWRTHNFNNIRPFFCQIEAVETAIWLTEVAPKLGKTGKAFLEHLANANEDANPELMRLALKLATGAGKTTVMAMLIAWQTINAVRRPGSTKFTRGFLVVTPGLTIKDRLRVLQPNDPDSYYESRELVPATCSPISTAPRSSSPTTTPSNCASASRSPKAAALCSKAAGEDLNTLETEGQMIQRVMPDLMGLKNILVLNDEAHHCYREKPGEADEEELKGDDKEEAREEQRGGPPLDLRPGNRKPQPRDHARYRSLGDAVLPARLRLCRGHPVPLDDERLLADGRHRMRHRQTAARPGRRQHPRRRHADVPQSLGAHPRKACPRRAAARPATSTRSTCPRTLQTALEALYGHYEKTFELWAEAGIKVPPCFIVVCNNTSTSKLVYDYISGFQRDERRRHDQLDNGPLRAFPQLRRARQPAPPPAHAADRQRATRIRRSARRQLPRHGADEIERFRREIIERTGDRAQAENITDQDLLREVMNTVGKQARLGESIRCVVSVSMLTEGWDANTVTHVLGVRAFGTQLLCEQVIGRALRRQSYDLNEEGLFNVEYADVLGIPFDFTAKPVIAPPAAAAGNHPGASAVRPDRDALEIRFPRVSGYRVELPEERLTAKFNEDSRLELDPRLVGATQTRNSGIVGEGVDLSLKDTGDERRSTVLFHLTQRLIYTKWREAGDDPKVHLFVQLKRIVKEWMDDYLECAGQTYPAQLIIPELGDLACERIAAAITSAHSGEHPIKVVLDPYNPSGSTARPIMCASRPQSWTAGRRAPTAAI